MNEYTFNFNSNTDICFVSGCIKHHAQQVLHHCVNTTVTNFLQTTSSNNKIRLDKVRNRILILEILYYIGVNIPDVRYIEKMNKEHILINDRDEIENHIWKRIIERKHKEQKSKNIEEDS